MKREHILAIVVIGLALTVGVSLADLVPLQEDRLFTTDGVIQEGDYYETVAVYDTPPEQTTVDMTGGAIGRPFSDSGLYTFDSSTVNITGGDVYLLETHDLSVVNISGGTVGTTGTYASSHESSTTNVYEGGSFAGGSFATLDLLDLSTLNILGGRVDVLVGLGDSSVANVLGGYTLQIGASDSSVVNVYGGTIDSFRRNTYIADTSTVNIYGTNIAYDPRDHWIQPPDKEGWWMSKLTGIGLDGKEIVWRGLPDPATHPNINIIPEPSSMTALILGGLALLRKRTKANKERKGSEEPC